MGYSVSLLLERRTDFQQQLRLGNLRYGPRATSHFSWVIGTVINPLQVFIYLHSAKKNRENPDRPIPEARLYTSNPGSLLFAAGLFWYAWGSVGNGSVHWIVPSLGIGCTGFGIYFIYMAVVNYLTDSEKCAASVLSAASMGRNRFGAFLPLSSYELFETLGYGWADSLLGSGLLFPSFQWY
jgi:hypothetical protein